MGNANKLGDWRHKLTKREPAKSIKKVPTNSKTRSPSDLLGGKGALNMFIFFKASHRRCSFFGGYTAVCFTRAYSGCGEGAAVCLYFGTLSYVTNCVTNPILGEI